MPTRILAIESSCDETAAAVVEDQTRVLSSAVASQTSVHARYGGVVPELASREHLRSIVPVVRDALQIANIGLGELSAIAVTEGPGLVGSLLVGITYAKALAVAKSLPLIAVNHVEGHIQAVLLEARAAAQQLPLPAVALVASGGHTHLFSVDHGQRYRLLAKTRDDAAGEAYDKVAKLLGFGYPGGPVIDKLAPHGNPKAVRFSLAKMSKGNALDLSFSGIKTAVLRWVEAHAMTDEIAARKAFLEANPKPGLQEWLQVTPPATLDLLASFQHTVVEELLWRVKELVGQPINHGHAQALIVSGGVAANQGLRSALTQARLPVPVFVSSPGLSTDNAAMIAAAAFPKYERREFASLDLSPKANLPLANERI